MDSFHSSAHVSHLSLVLPHEHPLRPASISSRVVHVRFPESAAGIGSDRAAGRRHAVMMHSATTMGPDPRSDGPDSRARRDEDFADSYPPPAPRPLTRPARHRLRAASRRSACRTGRQPKPRLAASTSNTACPISWTIRRPPQRVGRLPASASRGTSAPTVFSIWRSPASQVGLKRRRPRTRAHYAAHRLHPCSGRGARPDAAGTGH